MTFLLLVIKCDAVKYLFAPQYEALSIDCIIEKAAEYKGIDLYFPDARDQHKLPRQWILNVIYTLVGQNF